MAILDAPTYAFDQRLFNLYNPSFPDFTGDIQAKWMGKAYTPLGFITPANYWSFLGDNLTAFGSGLIVTGIEIFFNPTEANIQPDQLVWRWTTTDEVAINTSSLIVAIGTENNLDDKDLFAANLFGADTFNLSGLNDYAIGYGGNDTMNGEAGNDTLMGHLGADSLSGGAGDDVFLYTDASQSTLSEMDTITDYARGDTIELSGSQGLDSSVMLYQGSVSDTVNFIRNVSFPTDTIYFFTDNTTAWYAYVKGDGDGDDSRVSFDGTLIKINSNDTTAPFVLGAPVLTSDARYSLGDIQQAVTYIGNNSFGQTGTFYGVGNPLANTMIGGNGSDTLYGLSGNDSLDGGLGNDSMLGGRGDDTFTYTVGDTIVEQENEGIDTILVRNQGLTMPDHVENLTLTENTTVLPIFLFGNDEDNTMIGTENGESLSGMYGDDTLYGGGGNDLLSGGEGGNFIVAGDGDDVIALQDGRDYVLAGEGNDQMIYRSGEHLMYGGNGTDTLSFQVSSVRSVKVNLEGFSLAVYFSEGRFSSQHSSIYEIENVTGARLVSNFIHGNELNNVLIGGDFNDSISGGRGNDILHSGLGNDTVAGGLGNDLMYEALGDDIYRVDNINDLVMVNPNAPEGGLDTIESFGSYNLNWSDAQIENLRLKGESSSNAVGNGLDNKIFGNTASNLLQGLAGRDSISGGDGNDTLEGGLGSDVLRGGTGRDVFRFSSRDDSRLGAGSIDQILDYNIFEDSIEFVGMEGVGFSSLSERIYTSVESGLAAIVGNQIYANKKVLFFAFDSNGSQGIYLYVNGAGTGTNYDGSMLRYSVELSGVASDGYLSGALVWIDSDNNGVRDWTDVNSNGRWDSGEGESWTLTDGQGRYSGLEGTGMLRVSANPNGTTTDISTGAVFTGSYAAPSDSRVISPLTSVLVASGNQQALKDAFGLEDVDLTSFDPLAAATAANGYSVTDAASAIHMQSVNAQIANILAVGASMMTAAGASGSSASTIANAIAQNLANAALAGPVDLASTMVISNAIAAGSVGVLTDGQRFAFNAQLAAVSSAMSEINNQIQAASEVANESAENNIDVDVTAVLRSVIAAQIVAQQTLAAQAGNAVMNNNGTLLTINAGNISQLLTEAATEVGQVLTPGASHRFDASIDDIQAAGLSADGNILVLKFNTNEVVFLPIESTGFSLAGIGYTPQQVIDLFTLRPAFTCFLNNSTAYLLPDLFAGDASLGLLYQWIDTSADAVVVGSNFGDFIVLQGTGNKAVNGAGGADVIDGGTGSTFVSGGTGGDAETFFLDGRAQGVSWSTITDFDLGLDKVTIWGWKAGVSRVSVLFNDVDTGGATGYTGLTLHFENLLPDGAAEGTLNANFNSITLSGLTLSDFGAGSLEELNAQIANGQNSHFVVGATNDAYGEHGYLFIH